MIFGKRNSALSDAELVYKYQKTQNAKYIGFLFDRYGSLVFGVSMKYLKNEDDCKDAVIKIFEKLIEDLKKTQVKHFKSWLYMVTKNFCLMDLRKKKIQSTDIDSLQIAIDEDEGPNQFLERELRMSALDKALQNLKPDQKSCVVMFYIEELSYKQIVERTGYTLNEVKSYIQNGKRNLKLTLESNYLNQEY